MSLTIRCLLPSLILGFLLCQSAAAHTTFKKEMGKAYEDMKVSCDACHVKGKPKSNRTDFGKLFEKEFEGMDITANFKSKKGEEKKKYEKEVMIPAFQKALTKIKKLKNEDGKTYDELIKAGEIPGIEPKNDE